MRAVLLIIFDNGERGNPGAAIGANETMWQVVLNLQRAQFGDLLVLVASEKLTHGEVLLENLRRGHGIVRSASIGTEPVPSDREDDEGAEAGQCVRQCAERLPA